MSSICYVPPPRLDSICLRQSGLPLPPTIRIGGTISATSLLPIGVILSRQYRALPHCPLKQVKAGNRRRVCRGMVQELNTTDKAQAFFRASRIWPLRFEDEIKERKEKNPNASLTNAPGLDRLLTTFGHLRNRSRLGRSSGPFCPYEVFMKFMNIVLETVSELAPDAYEVVTQRIMSEWQLRQVQQGPKQRVSRNAQTNYANALAFSPLLPLLRFRHWPLLGRPTCLRDRVVPKRLKPA